MPRINNNTDLFLLLFLCHQPFRIYINRALPRHKIHGHKQHCRHYDSQTFFLSFIRHLSATAPIPLLNLMKRNEKKYAGICKPDGCLIVFLLFLC